MSDSHLLQHPRNRFLAFSVVGVAMVCLPLWQVLRYQQSELHHLAAERALLDPVARAVHVQLGLVAHRQLAGQLLTGPGSNAAAQEPARQTVQAGVDDELLRLKHELTQGAWFDALAESRDLGRDWNTLVQGVKARALTPDQSHEAHALRIEQVVLVMDLVSAAEGLLSKADTGRPGLDTRLAAVAQVLTAASGDLALLHPAKATPAGDAGPHAHAARVAQRVQAVQQQMARLERLLAQRAADATSGTAATALPHSLQAAFAELKRRTGDTLRAAQSESGSGPVPLMQAQQAAHQAQQALWEAVVALHKRGISQRVNQVQRQQLALGLALALLGSTALVLAAGLLRRLRVPPVPPLPATTGDGLAAMASQSGLPPGSSTEAGLAPGSKQAEAAQLFDRLRSANDDVQQPPASPAMPEPEDTLPPGRS